MKRGRTGGHAPESVRGVSLVEVMVALAILVFGIYFIYDQFLTSGAVGRTNLKIAQGRAFAHQGLEELRACDYAALKAWTPAEGYEPIPADPHFYRKIELAPTKSGGGIEIRVLVAWDPAEKSEARSFNSPTQVARGVKFP